MEREKMFTEWLKVWKPKNANQTYKGGPWKEETLALYIKILKTIVRDLKIDDPSIKQNLFEYRQAGEYLMIYGKIINHPQFKSLQYYPIAQKSLKRYFEFLEQLK